MLEFSGGSVAIVWGNSIIFRDCRVDAQHGRGVDAYRYCSFHQFNVVIVYAISSIKMECNTISDWQSARRKAEYNIEKVILSNVNKKSQRRIQTILTLHRASSACIWGSVRIRHLSTRFRCGLCDSIGRFYFILCHWTLLRACKVAGAKQAVVNLHLWNNHRLKCRCCLLFHFLHL
ncbi:MAG: hypothetical protein G01um10148_195 [Parcubacteria group bacterium Gr01-1014_8]|nr:MAG: hypothetical protein G01um10148_195 [Parcubacteria group bacterium Gr01-1014_8]